MAQMFRTNLGVRVTARPLSPAQPKRPAWRDLIRAQGAREPEAAPSFGAPWLALLGALALVVPAAHAQAPAAPAAVAAPGSPAVGLPGTPAPAPAQAPAANVAMGQQIAAKGSAQGAAACITCHGERGEGSAAFPRLAGAGSQYLREQLDAFADGSRANAIMQPIAKALSEQERASLALYYSRLKAPAIATAARADAKPTDAGAWLAARGRWSDGLPACAQCHGPGGQGVGEQFPPLAGLPAAYIAEQLKAWRSNTRPPGPLKLMVSVAAKLSDADITAVSEHYAALGRQESSVPAVAAPVAPANAAAAQQKGSQP